MNAVASPVTRPQEYHDAPPPRALDDCAACNKPIFDGDWVCDIMIAGELRTVHEDCITFRQVEEDPSAGLDYAEELYDPADDIRPEDQRCE